MPYKLADEWSEARLNSVSISFQRQMIGKGDEKKKSQRKVEAKPGVDSPSTRSRKSEEAKTPETTQVDSSGAQLIKIAFGQL